MTDRTWYRSFFDEGYLRRYGPSLTPERTVRDVDGSRRELFTRVRMYNL